MKSRKGGKARSYLLLSFVAVVGLFGINSVHPIFNFSSFQPANDDIVSPVTIQKTIVVSGATDLSTAINQANSDCGAVGCEISVMDSGAITKPIILSDNRVLNFQGSAYQVFASISTGSTNEIDGNNAVFTRDPSWFAGKGTPGGDFNQINNADMFKVNGKSNVVIHDLAIDGSTQKIGYYLIEGVVPKPTGKDFHAPKGEQNEISLVDATNIQIVRAKIYNVQAHAIGGRGTNGLLVRDSDLSSDGWNKYQLIWIGQRGNSNIEIKHNFIHESSHAGIFIAAATGITIADNILDHNRVNTFATGPGGQIGLQEDTDHIVIENNIIRNAGYTPAAEVPKRGIDILGHGMEIHSQHIQIINNKIYDNAGTGISLKDNGVVGGIQTNDVLVEGNTFYGNGIAGSKAEASAINIDPGLANYNIVIGENEYSDDGKITNFSLIPGLDQ